MKKLVLSLAVMSATACSTQANHDKSSAKAASETVEQSITSAFDVVKAGEEYPTDSPMPASLYGKKVLVITTGQTPITKTRILVDADAALSEPRAGVDFPTDSPMPSRMVGKNMLVMDPDAVHAHRFLVDIQPAQAGRDFPTDGPASLNRNFFVWIFGESRFALSSVYAIEKARAGIDFPTDGPADLKRDFYVLVTVDDDGFLRNRIP